MMSIHSFKAFKVDVEHYTAWHCMVMVCYFYRLSVLADHPLGPNREAASLDHSNAIFSLDISDCEF